MAVSRLGVVVPSYRRVREMGSVIAFGVRFQAVSLAGMAREQGLNIGVAAIGGVSTLGLWTLTKRLLEFPALMFEPLHRVSFPYMSHMLAERKDPAPLIDRGAAVSATASGLVLVGAAAAAPELVPAVFGEQWREVAPIFQWICGSLLVAGPLAVVGVGFLYADDAPTVVLKATLWHSLALFAVTFPLLPVLGPVAIGIGSFSGAVVDAVIMSAAIRRRSASRPGRQMLPSLAVAAIAGAAGIVVTTATGPGLLAGIAGGLAAAAAYLVLMALVRPAVLADTLRLLLGAVKSGISRERTSTRSHEGEPADPVPAGVS
jgi:O-antigen/teichoic acid export membrane protein